MATQETLHPCRVLRWAIGQICQGALVVVNPRPYEGFHVLVVWDGFGDKRLARIIWLDRMLEESVPGEVMSRVWCYHLFRFEEYLARHCDAQLRPFRRRAELWFRRRREKGFGDVSG
jgi:hypothetical protein